MKTSVNLTIIFIAVAFVAIVGIVGGVLLTLYNKDATAFYGFFTGLIATVVGFGGVIYGQNKANAKLDEVKTQTNGTLSRLIDIALSKSPLTRADARVIEETAQKVGANTGTIETIDE